MRNSNLIHGFFALVLLSLVAACGDAVPVTGPNGVHPEGGDSKTIVSGTKTGQTPLPATDQSVIPAPPPAEPETCTAENDAAFCTRLGKNCDAVTAPDNCGTSRTVSCGTCTAPATCVANICTGGSDGGAPPTGGATPGVGGLVSPGICKSRPELCVGGRLSAQHPCLQNPELCKPITVPPDLVRRIPNPPPPPAP